MKFENKTTEGVNPMHERLAPFKNHTVIEKPGKPSKSDPESVPQKEQHYVDYLGINELTTLSPLTEQSVLHAVEERYKAGIYYTWAGLPLVAVNPFQDVEELYDEKTEERYRQRVSAAEELPPHIFAVGQKAYSDLRRGLETSNQSIIVSGESGAGKTWTTRSLMQFISDMTGTSNGEHEVSVIEQRILDSNPVLEAFGNACTSRNENSSRFGKYIQLQFNRDYQIVGAKLKTYLLEKTRVVHHAKGERTFHIFYQMASGSLRHATPGKCPKARRRSSRWGGEDFQAFVETCEAMRNIGIHDETQAQIFEVLSSIKDICSVAFSKDAKDNCHFARPEQACEISSLLSVNASTLAQSLTVRRITTRGSGEVFIKPCTVHECEARRDCMAKLIYSRLFDWIVQFINHSIKAPSHSKHAFIGLLDVYGFESFRHNSLEQLCINYANEKLQQHFVTHFLRKQQDEYLKEGLEWNLLSFADNRACLDLLEGKVSVFALMSEECRLNRVLDSNSFSDRLQASLGSNKHFSQARLKSRTPNFVVRHYAGDVCYEVDGLVEKNKDHSPDEVIELLQTSGNWLVQELFPTAQDQPKQHEGGSVLNKPRPSNVTVVSKFKGGSVLNKPRPSNVTVVSKFKSSLDKLMSSLQSTKALYIRCVKPNSLAAPGIFDKEQVLSQLHACGVMETIRISAAGYPIRLSHREFITRYNFAVSHIKPTLPLTPHKPHPSPCMTTDSPMSPDVISRLRKAERRSRRRRRSGYDHTPHLCQSILAAVGCYGDEAKENASSDPDPRYKLGRTKIFLREEAMEKLERARDRHWSKSAFTVQCCWRRYKSRMCRIRTAAAVIIQKVSRGLLVQRRYTEMRRAAITIQRFIRSHLITYKTQKQSLMEEVTTDNKSTAINIHTSPTRNEESLISRSPDSPPCSRSNSTVQWTGWFDPFAFASHVYSTWGSRVTNLFQKTKPVTDTNPTIHTFGGIVSKRTIEQDPVVFHCRQTPLTNASTRPLRTTATDPGLRWLSSL